MKKWIKNNSFNLKVWASVLIIIIVIAIVIFSMVTSILTGNGLFM